MREEVISASDRPRYILPMQLKKKTAIASRWPPHLMLNDPMPFHRAQTLPHLLCLPPRPLFMLQIQGIEAMSYNRDRHVLAAAVYCEIDRVCREV